MLSDVCFLVGEVWCLEVTVILKSWEFLFLLLFLIISLSKVSDADCSNFMLIQFLITRLESGLGI